jgi:hypothetical protein
MIVGDDDVDSFRCFVLAVCDFVVVARCHSMMNVNGIDDVSACHSIDIDSDDPDRIPTRRDREDADVVAVVIDYCEFDVNFSLVNSI